ncbi:MAG: hypothetical protein IJ092_13550 [Atopobiaceae bacterium]|nr:hypothetical protein [Atopobiaceae bacterium]
MDEQFGSPSNKIDYLYLPDDELEATGKIEVTQEIPAVSDLGSTGEFLLADEDLIVPVVATPIRTDGTEAEVYGLDIPKPTYDDRPAMAQRSSLLPIPTWAVAALVGGLLVILLGTLVLPRCTAPKQKETPAPTPTPVEKVKPEIEPALSAEDVRALVGSLSYDGADVKIPTGDVAVEVKDGHVVVAHTLQSVEGVDATALVNDSSRRAAALASGLTKQRVDAAEDKEGTEFSKLTWVVRLADGSVLLAVDEAGGTLRKAEGALGLIAGAKGYVVSPDLLAALGENSGLSAQAGEAPTDINGAAISATAAFPHEEPEPEPQPEEQAQAEETYVEETYYPQETYVEETYVEETYVEPTYEEPAYTEPVNEEPTYEAPADAGGYEEFNYQGDGEGEGE